MIQVREAANLTQSRRLWHDVIQQYPAVWEAHIDAKLLQQACLPSVSCNVKQAQQGARTSQPGSTQQPTCRNRNALLLRHGGGSHEEAIRAGYAVARQQPQPNVAAAIVGLDSFAGSYYLWGVKTADRKSISRHSASFKILCGGSPYVISARLCAQSQAIPLTPPPSDFEDIDCLTPVTRLQPRTVMTKHVLMLAVKMA
ncbi:hypothetical protein HaLaN_22878 [Haematococcus lacustris]|uniref:Uncharacterized protein n=1 Tax=Haematococcus lacustris TaxID=44745 RepID=A0A699ZRM5_HAELA|nr:hypothetical protein HaLaN_22878 [Haematococcus lacustris]